MFGLHPPFVSQMRRYHSMKSHVSQVLLIWQGPLIWQSKIYRSPRSMLHLSLPQHSRGRFTSISERIRLIPTERHTRYIHSYTHIHPRAQNAHRLSCVNHSPIIKQLFVIRHSRYKIEDLIVGHGMRPEDLPRELIDAPGENQVSDRNEIEHDRADNRQDHRHVAQVRDREVEEILHSFAQAGYVADRVLNGLRDLLDRLQTLLQALLLLLKKLSVSYFRTQRNSLLFQQALK